MVDLVDQQGRLFRYTLVDSLEANPSDGRISIDSPLGQSLLDRKAQEVVSWQASFGMRKLQVVSVQ